MYITYAFIIFMYYIRTKPKHQALLPPLYFYCFGFLVGFDIEVIWSHFQPF